MVSRSVVSWGSGRWAPGHLLTTAPLQRHSHSWKYHCHQLRTPAAVNSLRRSGGSGWRRRAGWGIGGCEAWASSGAAAPGARLRSLPRLTLGNKGSALCPALGPALLPSVVEVGVE